MDIKKEFLKINEDIPDTVTILAATKSRSIGEVIDVIDAGARVVGENYVQEAKDKYEALKESFEENFVKFHLIGHLQTNKVKLAVQMFDMIETVDSVKLAQEIDKHCRAFDKVMPVLIEVNIGNETSKSGCKPDDVLVLAKQIKDLPNVELRGLMTMAPFFENMDDFRPFFSQAKGLFDSVQKEISDSRFDTLSMGMSKSYAIAIEEGATMVRLGSAIFGPRS